MIIDSLKHAHLYPFGPEWTEAFKFIHSAVPEMEKQKVVLQDDRLVAIVDGYNTKSRSEAKLETHRKYVDIQVLLSGSECLEVFPKEDLSVSVPYNAEKDAEFYQVPDGAPIHVTLTPGQFIVFFPEDAHMTCLMSGTTPEPVKKVVIKLAAECLKIPVS